MLLWLRDNLVAKHSPPVAVPQDILPAILKLLDLQPNVTLYDLGCGDGRVLRAAGQTGVQCVGIEKGITQYLKAVAKTSRFGVKIIEADMLKTDLHSASRVFTYLHSTTMQRLAFKLKSELPEGSVLVSCDFQVPGKKPSRTERVQSSQGIKPFYTLYQYQF